jgi:ribulose-5-phosphate 4-epimerase/fuculose-1-phosphate aldolase
MLKHFSLVDPDDLLLVDEAGDIVKGDGELNLAAFAIHSRLHHARPDVVAAAHAHSPFGKVWSTTGRLLQPLTQDGCAFFEDHALFDRFGGVVLDLTEGDLIAEELGDRKAIILANHGLLTVGQSVEEAAWWFLTMEDACRTQVQAEMIGRPQAIPDDLARQTARQVGSSMAGRLQFEYELQAINYPRPKP